MNPDHRSKEYFPSLSILVVMIWVLGTGCALSPERQGNRYTPPSELTGEVSLSDDRAYLSKMRDQTPAESIERNDDLALILKWMEGEKSPPYKVRSRFNSILSRKRNNFRKQMRKERERFNKEERVAKDKFLKEARKERESLKGTKRSREEVREFSKKQDEERRDYFANQRDRRKDFETEMRRIQKDFDQNIRDKRREFDREYREYVKRYNDRKKREKLEKREKRSKYRMRSQRSSVRRDSDVKEFHQPYSGPRIRLQPDEDN